MERVAEPIKFLSDVNRHEKEFGIVQVMAGLENAGDGQFLRQNNIAQFVDRFLLFLALRVLEFFNAIENFAEIARRIDGDLVADIDP